MFQVPKNDPRNRSHSIHSTDDLDDRRKEEADFKKIVTDMFKELETERKDQRKKMNDLERYILELKAETSELLEVIKELRYRLVLLLLSLIINIIIIIIIIIINRDSKVEKVTEVVESEDKHALSGKADNK